MAQVVHHHPEDALYHRPNLAVMSTEPHAEPWVNRLSPAVRKAGFALAAIGTLALTAMSTLAMASDGVTRQVSMGFVFAGLLCIDALMLSDRKD